MKKVKIMFLSLAVVAAVGGALAFKSSTKFSSKFYTTNVPGAACTVRLDATTLDDGAKIGDYWYTTTPTAVPGNPCFQASISFYEE